MFFFFRVPIKNSCEPHKVFFIDVFWKPMDGLDVDQRLKKTKAAATHGTTGGGKWGKCWLESFPTFFFKMDVSKNKGTPKWMVYNGKPY